MVITGENSAPGTALLLAAAPAGKGRLVDAASVLPALAAVPASVLTGTTGAAATVIELADPLDPQTVLTRIRAAAAAPGPLFLYLAGQLHVDRKQQLLHFALARTTPATVRYTALPWHWLAGELRTRRPGTTTVVVDLVADGEAWQQVREGRAGLGPGTLLYGRIAPAPGRRTVVPPAYLKAVATIWRSGARPPFAQLHEQAASQSDHPAGALLFPLLMPTATHGATETSQRPVAVEAPAAAPPSAAQAPAPEAVLREPSPAPAPAAGLRDPQPAAQAPGAVLRATGPAPAPGANSTPTGEPPAPAAVPAPVPLPAAQPPATPAAETRTTPSPALAPAQPPTPSATPPSAATGVPHDADGDPHPVILAAARAGRHTEAAAAAAACEGEALRVYGPGSVQALHWLEVRADLARLARDPARSCELWMAVADARLRRQQTADDPDVEGAVDRAHHQWEQVRDAARARRLAPELVRLRRRVPGRQRGALQLLQRRLEQLQ
ncbi:hypothetical protein HW130_22580 [Streptomyces sp. PKU-EA00015]|uniref:hypothetical protein n=1 Tax=Streptomyces sp. PKU-EA00015 TaxID=2748326 RepID=UPI0015A13063|nr:hypothetical protein [Streptomyces sp. PKU-EA00015]NWF29009.1 hypothetical protein [Streptomyces sp. PKU-EA00015]